MKTFDFIFKYAGVSAIPAYIAFTYASHIHNRQINPLKYWLSDYGNPLVNPDGAVLYNAGCVITALLLAVFYIGMYRWYRRGRAEIKFNVSFAVAQAGGLIGSVFLILTAVYTLGVNTETHSLFSTLNMIAMDFFLAFTATGFLLNPKMHKSIPGFGFIAAIFNIITMNAFVDFFLSEWIFFLLFMAYMVIILFQRNKLTINQ